MNSYLALHMYIFITYFVDISAAYALLSVIGKRVCIAELRLLLFQISLITNAWVDICRTRRLLSYEIWTVVSMNLSFAVTEAYSLYGSLMTVLALIG